jgi:hypothetical protein
LEPRIAVNEDSSGETLERSQCNTLRTGRLESRDVGTFERGNLMALGKEKFPSSSEVAVVIVRRRVVKIFLPIIGVGEGGD